LDIKKIDVVLLERMFKQSNQELKRNIELVNDLNVFPVPDGDTGTNMSLTLQSAIESINSSKMYSIETISKEISKGSLMGARGNSGVILSQIFRGFAKGCEGKEELSAIDLANALEKASEVAYKAVMKPIEGTILTVIRKTSEYAVQFVNEKTTIDEIIDYIISIAENEFGYCTEFIVKGSINAKVLKEKIMKLGDSMVFVENEDIVKVHIHTNNPGIALEYALKEGELIKIKIENMREQHTQLLTEAANEVYEEKKNKKSKYEIIAVAIGAGISTIFEDLGVTQIIEGGQTMNPSTKDLLEKIDKTNADNIIILPNNGNIILAAEQAKKISDKNIYIVPTKTIPQGINSLIEFDWEDEPEKNIEKMKECISNINTVEITYSVKDTVFDDIEIKENEILGVSEGKIISVGDNLHDITLKTIKSIINKDTEIITIYFGEDVQEEEANNLAEEIEKLIEFGDVEVYYGGQPLYYYLISVE